MRPKIALVYNALVPRCLKSRASNMFARDAVTITKGHVASVTGIHQTRNIIRRIPRSRCVEHSTMWHLPFAKGRIENGLSPAPRRTERPFYLRWAEAVSVLKGRSIGVRCHYDMAPPEGQEEYVDGEVGRHPLLERKPAE